MSLTSHLQESQIFSTHCILMLTQGLCEGLTPFAFVLYMILPTPGISNKPKITLIG